MTRIARMEDSCSIRAIRVIRGLKISPVRANPELDFPWSKPVARAGDLAEKRTRCVCVDVRPERPVKCVQELGAKLDAHRFNRTKRFLQRKIIKKFPRSPKLRERE